MVGTDLLAWVFEGVGGPRRINILDVGPAMPQTVEFFNSMRCRLHLADLFDNTIIEQQLRLDEDALAVRFADALWMLDGPLHACLLWDFPNYLAPPALEAFNRALSPWVTPHTRAHAFCAVKRSAPLMQHRYSILSANEVVQMAAPERPPARYPHPWRRLAKALPLFDVARGALRAEGIVEVILRGVAQPSTAAPLLTGQDAKDVHPRPLENPEQLADPDPRAKLSRQPIVTQAHNQPPSAQRPRTPEKGEDIEPLTRRSGVRRASGR